VIQHEEAPLWGKVGQKVVEQRQEAEQILGIQCCRQAAEGFEGSIDWYLVEIVEGEGLAACLAAGSEGGAAIKDRLWKKQGWEWEQEQEWE